MSNQWQAPGAEPAGGAWQQPAGQPGGQSSGGWQGQQGQHQGQVHQAQQPGGLHLRTGFFVLAFLLHFFPPKCSIDGSTEIALRWGDNHLPVPAGRHVISVWFPYLFFGRCGVADTVIDVPAAGMALEYKAPTWFVFSKGTLLIPGYGPAPAAQPQMYGGQQAYAAQQAYGAQPHQGAQPVAAAGNPAGWHADPTGRYEQRYWDGQGWTPHVFRSGVQASDPI